MLSAEELRPVSVESETAQGPEDASVRASFGAGEVFLRDEDERVHRLTWKQGESSHKRVMQPGTYRLMGYRIDRDEWFVSASGGSRELELEAGRTTELELDSHIRFGLHVNANPKAVRVAVNIQGHDKMGLSIYRWGTRISIPYSVTSADEQLAQGAMRYG